jgi:hypothetical protein
LNTLTHFGVKGMKWGVRKERKREAERKRAQKRPETLKRIKEQGLEDKFNKASYFRGEKSANRILDIMGDKPSKSYKSASAQQFGEEFVKNYLIYAGAKAAARVVRGYVTG